MKHAQSVRFGAWMLIGLNLLMAFGAIGVFMRMAPAIGHILDRNEQSLEACERMNGVLALVRDGGIADDTGLRGEFERALRRAQNNITEAGEPAALDVIRRHYVAALAGSYEARRATVEAVHNLANSNRLAMVEAAREARQLCLAGAWGVVFMALSVFVAGILFKRSILRNLVEPLEEVDQVLVAVKNGDRQRRCRTVDLPPDVRNVLGGINDLLDRLA